MPELAYSLHLGSDKNRKNISKQNGKNNLSGTTSLPNNAIQNVRQLSKVDKHNYRKYDNEQELIEIVRGTSSPLDDVKELYLKEFEEARLEYNSKQSRPSRMIDNYFENVAIKTTNGFITTIRGKEDLNEYTLVLNVDHDNHIINVLNKKATLNAPLLDYIFKNRKVKAIVHLHEFDNKLPFYDYAFPGTLKDSVRDNTTSFNIMYHGVIYLFDKNGNIL